MNNLTEINDNMPLSELEKERIKRIAHLLCNEKIENCSIELNEEQYALFIDEWNKERQINRVYSLLPNFDFPNRYCSPMGDINNFLEALDKEVDFYGRIVKALYNNQKN